MTEQQILEQSKAAYKQWCEQWREHATYHSKHKMLSLTDFENVGIGKAILCVANGYSFEENIETIKANSKKVDILCCDKTLGHLLDNGITPTYCMVCDANVDYEKYMEPYKDKLQNTVLFVNVCGATKWTDNGNWKSIYFFANKDILGSEKEFMKLSGCPNAIPAATNVSNAMVVFLTQSDNYGKRNFFGYDKILLIGYDYSWRFDGNYYAFDKDGGGKKYYMRHLYLNTFDGDWAYTSGNLIFSASWLDKYVKTFRLPVVQCSKKGIYSGLKFGNLKEQLDYLHKPEHSNLVRQQVSQLKLINAAKKDLENKILAIEKEHNTQFLVST
jgi:hypothetical protein